jgi:hypothetical protein
MRTVLIAIGLAGLLLPCAALAEPRAKVSAKKAAPARAAPAKPQAVAKPQRLIFGDDLVEAGRDLGGGSIVGGRRPLRMSRLIPVRTHFLPELIKSAEDI